jgi:flagellar protein FliO/FliZ
MFDSLFGAEMPLAVRFFLAFLIVLGLIGATAWAVRRFGTGRLGGSNTRGRQPRLAVIDYASVDARRRLILVRRDNVEHLLMIGGPTDVVVEANIVRAVAASRDVTGARPAASETGPRALSENGSNGSWPLQPDSAGTHRPSTESTSQEPAAWPLQPHAEMPGRPPRDTLTALADEIAPRPFPMRNRNPAGGRTNSSEPRIPAAPAASADSVAATDQSLAEMAHRLEAALRKPSATADARAPAPAEQQEAAPAAETAAPAAAAATPAPAAPPRPTARVVESKPPRNETKQPMPSKTLYDSLEQEMASLLGRPTGKT